MKNESTCEEGIAKSTQIPKAINQQRGSIANLEEVVNSLESKLSTVLQEEPPQPEDANKTDTEFSVGIAKDVHSNTERIRIVLMQLSNVISRLEL